VKKDASGVYTRVSHYADWIQQHTGPLKGASAAANAPLATTLTAGQIDQGLAQLHEPLGFAQGRVRIGIVGGNRVRLGGIVVFAAEITIADRLLILAINANVSCSLV
jgi:hypothetical protein